MKIKVCLLVALLCLVLHGAFSQNNAPKIIPPSPQTASLLQYAQIPVGKYTGLPSINIPIYTIKSGTLELPISISYHAAGIKPSQEASPVGLGWALNAGGVIGREIRGQDDLSLVKTGYFKNPHPTAAEAFGGWNYSTFALSSSPLYPILTGDADAQPDLFYFNFCGFSGQFIIPKQDLSNGVHGALIDQKDNIKILLINQDRFVLTDGNGTNYYFGTKEYSYTESRSQSVPLYQDFTFSAGLCDDEKTVSSWYIDSLVAKTGDRIVFNYDVPPSCTGIRSQKSTSFAQYDQTQYIGTGTQILTPEHVVEYSYYRTLTQEVRLTGIGFNNGIVQFNSSSRSDIEGYGGYNPQKVESIDIVSTHGTLRHVEFNYSYFDNNSTLDYARLKLDSVKIDEKPYRFGYRTDISMPSKTTFSVDHWGLFNNAINNTLLPLTSFNNETVVAQSGGANRETNTLTEQLGILKEITYPTGGKTKFNYESNEFNNTSPQAVTEQSTVQLEATDTFYANVPSAPLLQQDFYVPITTTGKAVLSINTAANSTQPCDGIDASQLLSIVIAIPDTNLTKYGSVYDYSPYYTGGPTINPTAVYSQTMDDCSQTYKPQKNCEVQSGKWYRLVVAAPQYFAVNTSVSYQSVLGYKTQRAGAGLRVESIKTVTKNDSSVVHYRYKSSTDTSRSSGKLMSEPVYNIDQAFPMFFKVYRLVKSESYTPMSTAAQGSYVGYSEVDEIFGENGENGKKHSVFQNEVMGGTYFTPPHEAIDNGLLKSETVLSSSGNPVQSIENQYAFVSGGNPSNAYIAVTFSFLYNCDYYIQYPDDPDNHYIVPWNPINPELAAAYLVHGYAIQPGWWYLSSSTKTDYHPTGNVATIANYNYLTANRKVHRQEVTTSDGSTLISVFKYPSEYTSAAGNVFPAMVAANMIEEPVEILNWKKEVNGSEKLISSSVTEFKDFTGNGLIKPYKTYHLVLDHPLSTTETGITSMPYGAAYLPTSTETYPIYTNLLIPGLQFERNYEYDYDSSGNTVRVTVKDRSNVGYAWGYNQSYPIAECMNATNAEFYFQGFEDSGTATAGTAHTGKKYTTSPSVSWTLPNSRTYVISYWYLDNGIWKYSGEKPFTGSVTMQSAAGYDDIRIYPQDAQMTTYTYDPLVGMTSMTDARSKTNHYEYDSFQRLANIRDQDGKLLKHMDYHYTGQ